MELILRIILGALLLCCGIQDALKKKVYLWVIVLGMIASEICILFIHSSSIVDRLGGVGIGIAVIILSLATGGKIGLGDGLLLCATGLGLGFWGNLELFGISLFITAIVSIVLLIFRLADKKKSLPFVPFLFVGYLIYTLAYARIN